MHNIDDLKYKVDMKLKIKYEQYNIKNEDKM